VVPLPESLSRAEAPRISRFQILFFCVWAELFGDEGKSPLPVLRASLSRSVQRLFRALILQGSDSFSHWVNRVFRRRKQSTTAGAAGGSSARVAAKDNLKGFKDFNLNAKAIIWP